MATIPDPNREARTIARGLGTIARASSNTYGAGEIALGASMRKFADDGFAIQAAEKQRIDNLKVDDAFNEYKKHLIDLQVGDNGYQKVKGKGVTENQFLDSYKSFSTSKIAELKSTLGNEDQKEKFNAMANNAALGFEMDVMSHAMREEETARAGVLAGVVEVGVLDSQHNFYDDAKVDANKLRIKEQADMYYDGRKSPEEKKAFIDEAISQIETIRAYQYIEKEEFDEVDKRMQGWETPNSGSAINPTEMLRIKAKLKEKESKNKGRVVAFKAIENNPDDNPAQVKELKDLVTKGEITTEVYDNAMIRVESEQQRKDKQRTRDMTQITDDVMNTVISSEVSLYDSLELIDEKAGEYGELKSSLRQAVIALKSGGPKHSEVGAREEARGRIDGQSFIDRETGETLGPITNMNQFLSEYAHRLTKTDRVAVAKYMEGGGIMATLSDSQVRSVFKTVTGKEGHEDPVKYAQAWDYISARVKPNQKFTDNDLLKMMRTITAEGQRQHNLPKFYEGFFGWGWKAKDMNYNEALSKGLIDEWFPRVHEDEEDIIDAKVSQMNYRIRAYNKKAPKDDQQNLIPDGLHGRAYYKKHFMIGLPLPPKETGAK
jgi:hypothetical protein